jgi:hypothetical protein
MMGDYWIVHSLRLKASTTFNTPGWSADLLDVNAEGDASGSLFVLRDETIRPRLNA